MSEPVTKSTPVIAPPFTIESATLKVRLAEDAWNSRDPFRERKRLRKHGVERLAHVDRFVPARRDQYVPGD